MSTTAFPYPDIELEAAPVRRVSVALSVSALLHLLVLAMLGGLVHFQPPTSPFGTGGNLVLKALLVGPDTPAQAEAPSAMSTPAKELTQADVPPPRTAIPAPALPAAVPGSALQRSDVARRGTPDPPVMITSRPIFDPRLIGPSFAEDLARQFPDPVQRPPELRTSIVMLYPRAALDARRQARIAVQLTVDENGAIVDQKKVPDDPMFAPAIDEVLKEVRFAPALLDGKFVRSWAILEFVFTIQEPGLTPPPR